MKTFNILDYGADNLNKGDSSIALQKAMEDIRVCDGEKTLVFPKGEYHFHKENSPVRVFHTSNTNSTSFPEKYCGFLIENQENLIVDGDGSMFIFHGDMQAVTILKSKNITVKNFSWDFAVPTTAEMTVKNCSPFSCTFEINEPFKWEINNNNIVWYEESPLSGKRYRSWEMTSDVYCMAAVDPDTEKAYRLPPLKKPFCAKRKIKKLSDNLIKVSYWRPWMKNYKEGLCIVMCDNTVRPCSGAFIWESENVRVENLSVHYLHGLAFLTQMCKNVSFKNVDFIPNPNTLRRCSSFADSIHVSGASGLFEVIDCNFRGTQDDPINVHGTFTRVAEKLDSKTLVLEYVHNQQGGFPQFHIGDKVAFHSRDMLESINGENERLYTVESCTEPDESGKKMTVRFTEELPENIDDNIGNEKKFVAENVTYTPDVIIKGCTMKTVTTRGILCTTRGKVLIENNVFDGMTMASIFLSNDSDEWYESGPIRDMTIRNNIFYILKAPQKEWADKGAVYIHPVTKGGKLPSYEKPVHKNITVENNTFCMEHDKVVKAESVENLTIRNNKVKKLNTADADKTVTAYEFNACKNVRIYGNKYGDKIIDTSIVKNMPSEEIKSI